MKNPLTPAGIEPATFRFVAQHLNHCATLPRSPTHLCFGGNWSIEAIGEPYPNIDGGWPVAKGVKCVLRLCVCVCVCVCLCVCVCVSVCVCVCVLVC